MASGVILAGGASSRMGRDKLSLTVGGIPLVRRAAYALSAHCDELLVVGAAEKSLTLPEARHVPDLRTGRQGPLAGIEAGLTAARNPRVFVAAGDLPLLPRDLIGYLLDLLSREHASAVVPRYEDLHPLCAAYDREIRANVSEALDGGERSVSRFLYGLPDIRYVDEAELRMFGDPAVFLMNVNSPRDLEQARTYGGGA